MVALHQARQHIQESFRTVQRVHMNFRFVLGKLVIRIQHYSGDVTALSLSTKTAAVR